MAATELAPPHSELLTWRIDLGTRADCTIALRDYLLRLGFAVTQNGPSRLRVEADVDADSFRDYVDSWGKIHRVALDAAVGEQAQPAVAAPAAAAAQQRPRLGDLLVRKGFISEDQLTSALVHARAENVLLGVALLRDGVVFEDELARTLAEQLAIPYVSILRIGVDPRAVQQLPPEVGAAAVAIPTRIRGDVVQVAFADPTDAYALDEVRRYIPDFDPAVAEFSDITMAWSTFSPGAASGSRR
jgi:hypothetical protein